MNDHKRATIKSISGVALAVAAAGVFMSGVAATAVAADEAKVHCVGINACKGKSDCKTAESSCKGKNACKGKGFVATTEKQCKEKGGTVEM
ncbi:MAG: hypothetical protein ABI794_05005 [Betaproteobacteria bacterium]